MSGWDFYVKITRFLGWSVECIEYGSPRNCSCPALLAGALRVAALPGRAVKGSRPE